MPRPVKDVAAVPTLQIIGPTFKQGKRPWKNRGKNVHTANILDGRVLVHIPVLFLLKLKPSNQERHLVLTSLKEAGRHRPFSVISLISMYEWEYTLGQQQQVAPRSTPILHRTKNALEWGLWGILSKFGHARLLWLLGSSQISKSPMQMCTPSSQILWQLQKCCLKHDSDAYFLDFDELILTWRRVKPWSRRWLPQGEAAPLHSGVGWPLRFPQMWETRARNFC